MVQNVFYDDNNYDTKLVQEGHYQSILLKNTWKDISTIELVVTSSLQEH